ncbi:MAG: hypothetical protein HC886_08595 [Leptolyngbyaceae cyanobacterium SM1_1_3]|nr:hypothetical protein [Leptolyngbyaceae cyanobacterium SM1_1_3]
MANWQIRLSKRQAALLVLAEHEATEAPGSAAEAAAISGAIETILRSLLDQMAQAGTLETLSADLAAAQIPIRIYLRRLREKQPYQTRSLLWRNPDPLIALLADDAALPDDPAELANMSDSSALVPFQAPFQAPFKP